MFDFAGADTEGECAESAVCRSVRVAADDGHAGLGGAELRADHVDDALIGVLHVEELDAELGAVLAQRVDLRGGDLVRDDEAIVCGSCGHVVIDGGDVTVGAAEFAACHANAVEGLRGGDLVDELEIDVEDRRLAGGFGDDVILPHLLKHGAWLLVRAVGCAHDGVVT